MKKLLLTLSAIALFAFDASAQTEQGKIMLGGSVLFQANKNGGLEKASHNFAIMPNAGYFVSDNFALGTGLGYTYSKARNGANPTGLNESIMVSPFARKYVNLSDQFKFFGQASVPLSFGTVKSTDADGEVIEKVGSSTLIGVALSPGFAFFPIQKLGIEFAFNGFSYYNTRVKDENGDEIDMLGSDNFNIGTNFFSPQIGVQFHF